MNNYYQILDVSPSASLDLIKRAYRKKAKLYHPDINKAEDAHEKFILINEAYEYLVRLKDIKHRKTNVSSGKTDIEAFWREWKNEERRKARERAQEHARMKYEAYIKSDLYKATEVVNTIIDTLGTAFIFLIVVVMPFMLYNEHGVIAIIISALVLLPTSPLWVKFLIKSFSKKSLLKLFTFKQTSLQMKVVHFMILTALNFYVLFAISLNTLIELKWIGFLYILGFGIGIIISRKNNSLPSKVMILGGLAPALVGGIFILNFAFAHSPMSESYWYTSSIDKHQRYTIIELDNNQFDRFIGIRLYLNYNNVKANCCITYTFSEGLLGMRVASKTTLSNHPPSQLN